MPSGASGDPLDELSVLDETISRLRSRITLGDDSELPALGSLLLKYLERRAELVTPRDATDRNAGSIAAATARLELVGPQKKR